MIQPLVFASSEEAELAFYKAFERTDLEAMMSVWADDANIVCIHPAGPRLRGTAAIKASWELIFTAKARLKIILTDNRITRDTHIAVHLLKENIKVDNVLQGVMLVTNIYQLVDGSWRLILHHASPQPQIKKTTMKTKILH